MHRLNKCGSPNAVRANTEACIIWRCAVEPKVYELLRHGVDEAGEWFRRFVAQSRLGFSHSGAELEQDAGHKAVLAGTRIWRT